MPEFGGDPDASNETGVISTDTSANSSGHPAQLPTTQIEGDVDHVEASRNQRSTMFQFGAALQFMVNDGESSEYIRLQFVTNVRLVLFNMDAWHDMQKLVNDACNTYPVSFLIISARYKPINRE